MKKNVLKVVNVLIIVAMLVMMIANFSFAATSATDPAKLPSVNANTSKIENIGGQIIRIVSVIGSVVSVIVLIVLGIKYMMGSAEEKAEYKKTLLPYIIGAALVFAASAIASVIFSFTQGLAA